MQNLAQTRMSTEIIDMIYDDLRLMEIVRCSWVCRLWRCSALGHPTYGRIFFLTSCRRECVSFFVDRLQQTTFRGVMDVKIKLAVGPGLDYMTSHQVLTALSSRMSQISLLDLDMFGFHDKAYSLFDDAFAVSAPALRSFKIKCVSAPFEHGFSLPSNIFDGHAPRLRALDISEAYIGHEFPPAFYNVTHLSYAFYHNDSMQTLLEYNLPALNYLEIGTPSFDPLLLPAELPERLASLTCLTLNVANKLHLQELCSWAPLSTVREVCIRKPIVSHDVATRFLATLSNDVCVTAVRDLMDEFVRRDHRGRITVAELSQRSHTRSLIDVSFIRLADSILSETNVPFRVVKFRVPFSSLRHVLPWIKVHIGALKYLSVTLSPDDQLNLPLRDDLALTNVNCPLLSRVTFDCYFPSPLHAIPIVLNRPDLTLLLDNVFQWNRATRLQLELDGVTLTAEAMTWAQQWATIVEV